MDKYLKTADTEWYKQRITGVIICVLAAFVVIFIRLIYLQVIRGSEFRRLSLNNSIRLQNIDPPRGRLYDRNLNLLVDNRPSFDVRITLKDAEPIASTLTKLSQHIDIPEDTLMAKIKQTRMSGVMPWPLLR
jgi:penicillin-binding protein 2